MTHRSARAFMAVFLAAPAFVAAQSLPEQVVEQVNIARWENGELPPLKNEVLLTAASQAHSDAMAVRNFFMHCDPDTGKSPFTRMAEAGYAWSNAAENIAAGSSTASGAMAQWMGSTGHRANILATSLREIGIGYGYQNPDANNVRRGSGCTVTSNNNSGYRHYWTQGFGTRSSVYPLVIAREAYQTSTCLIDLYVYGAGFATQMRFSNNGSTWSDWQAYEANTLWTLQGAAGATATVYGEIRNGGGSVRAANDSIRLATACGGIAPEDRIFADSFD